MAQKTKYKTISVTPEVFVRVKLIADANRNSLGDQVEAWTEQELPECDHDKEAVSIETFPGSTSLVKSVTRQAWYCPTCKRVYAKIYDGEEPIMEGSHA